MTVVRAGLCASLLVVLGSACDRPAPITDVTREVADVSRARVVLDERVSPTTRLLHRDDGTLTAVVTPGPRAFRDESGQWQDISPVLDPAADGVVAKHNLLVARFPSTLSRRQGVRFEDRESGAGFSWRPAWKQAGASAPLQAEVAVARYPLPGAVEEFHVLRGGVKHNLVLERRDALDSALVSGAGKTLAAVGVLTLDPGLQLQPHGEALSVVGPKGAVFELPAPRAFELTGQRRSVAARYRWDANAGTLAVEVDEAWLRAPDRTFPLAIDPPATVFGRYSVSVLSESEVLLADGGSPEPLLLGPDALRVGLLDTSSDEYYQTAFKFDLSGMNAGATVTAVSLNVFFGAGGDNTNRNIHFARMTKDIETASASAIWNDGAHGANAEYATVTNADFNCDCWIGGGSPSTQSGTALLGPALSDVQAALSLPTRTFTVGVHVPDYLSSGYAEVHGILDLNPPQLYVDFTPSAPSVTHVAPSSVPAGTGGLVTVRGTQFRGQTGTTVQLVPVIGGMATAATVTYVSASQIQLNVSAATVAGVYDVVVTSGGLSSPVVPADRLVVTNLRQWLGSVSTSWSNANNWTPIGVPDATTTVVIASGASSCTLDVPSTTVHSLRFVSGTLLTAGNTLTVTQDLSLDVGTLNMTSGGTLNVGGNASVGSGNFIAGTGTLNLTGGSLTKPVLVTKGRVVPSGGGTLTEDAEPGTSLWTSSTVSGTANVWRVQEQFAASGYRAWYQQGLQSTRGSSALTSPLFSLAGKTTATLRWRHRYRINLEEASGPNASDGFAVQVSENGGTSWSTIAPHASSVGARAPKASGTNCPLGGTRNANPVPAAPAGLFAGLQTAWVQETVALPVGSATVRVRFHSGWDNCNDYSPWDGVYLDDVLITADESPLSLNNLSLSGSARVQATTPLTVGAALTVASASAALDLNGTGLTVAGALNNAGLISRGPGGAVSVVGTFTNGGTFEMGNGPVSFGALNNSGVFTGGTGDLTVASLSNSGAFVSGSGATNVNGNLSSSTPFYVAGTGLTVAGDINSGALLDLGKATLTLTSAGPSLLSGAGNFVSSRKLLFADGFESGGFAAGGWVATSDGTPADPQVVSSPPGVGSKVANLSAGNGYYNSWLTRSLNTTGESSLWLTFGRATSATAGAYVFDVEYSTDGGATWKNARSVAGTFTYTNDSINLSALDAAVNNNPAFRFRFHSYTSVTGNFHYVDDVRVEAAGPGLGPVGVTGAGVKTLSPSNPTQTVLLKATLNLSGGTLRVAPGKTLSIDNASALTSSTSAGTTLDIEPGATLALSAATTLQVGGTLELVGVSGTPARVTSTDLVTPGRYALTVSGGFNGSRFDVDYANAQGLNLAAGAAVTALDYGSFHRPPASGALLTLGTSSPPAVSTGCTFGNELSVSGAVGVNGALNPANIRFDAATGALAGEARDSDYSGLTPGNVRWGPTHFAFTSAPPTAGAGACTAMTVQAQDESNVAAAMGGNISVALSSSAGTTAFFTDPACASPAAGATLTAPASSLTFYFKDTVPGTVTVTASPTGYAAVTQVYTLVPGTPSKLSFTVQPSTTGAGISLSPAVQVAVMDDFSNVVTASSASISLGIATNPGSAVLSGTTTAAASSGVATFSNLSLNKAGNGYMLQAASGGLTSALSGAFSILAAAPNRLAFLQPPTNSTAGLAFAPTVQVAVQDAFGNTITSSSAPIALSFVSNPTGATLSGVVTGSATSGVASFPTVSIAKAGSGYTVQATSAGLTGVTSGAFNISPAAPFQLAFTDQPSNAQAGAALAPAVEVSVLDVMGNLVTSSSASVALALAVNPAGATLSGGSALAAVGGKATFPAVSLNYAAAGYQLTATSSGLMSATSNSFDIGAGAATRLNFAVHPPDGRIGVALTPSVEVEAWDAQGNRATAFAGVVTLTLGSNPGGATLTGGTATAALGRATFSALTLDKLGVGYALSATAPSLVGASSAVFNITAGPPTALVVTSVSQDIDAGSCSAPVSVQLRDAAGNPTFYAAAASLAPSSSLTSTRFFLASDTACTGSAVTSVPVPAGSATASFRFLDATVGTFTLTATVNGLSANQTAKTHAGPPAGLKVSSAPVTVAAGECSGQVTLEVQDSGGRTTTALADASVTLSSSSAAGRFFNNASCSGQVTTVTLRGGNSSATFYFTDTVAGTPTLSAAANGLGVATQAQVVQAGPAVALKLAGYPEIARAGVAAPFVVTAADAFENVAAGYTGTVTFASTDAAAALPSAYTFVSGDRGSRSFSASLATLGVQELEVKDGAMAAKQTDILVKAGPAAALQVTGVPSPTAVGKPLDFSVAAVDRFGHPVLDYTGTVRFSSSDTAAVLPQATTFAVVDLGKKSFSGAVTFATPGTHLLSAQDASSSTVRGEQLGIFVVAASSPLVLHDANLHAAVGKPYLYNALGVVRAVGAPVIAFSACGGPASFQVDALTGGVRWTPEAPGSVTLCVAAKNSLGEDRFTFVVSVVARAVTGVTASFMATPAEGPAPLRSDLDATASTADVSAQPMLFRWSLGDGSSPGVGDSLQHRYLLPGGYRPRLTAFDAFGTSAQTSRAVSVRNAKGDSPPAARIVASALRGRNELTVDLSCDCAEGSAKLAGYLWDLGDGTTSTSSTASVTLSPGRYHVGLLVVDAAGLTAVDKVEVVVTDEGVEPPECSASVDPPSGLKPLAATWTALGSSPGGKIAEVAWSFGDGEESSDAIVGKGYADAGRFGGHLRVVDEAGLTCTDRTFATVVSPAGVPPRIVSRLAPTASCGTPYEAGALAAAGDGPFSWSAPGAPEGFAVAAATGAVSWTPTPAQRGAHELRIRVETAAGSDERVYDVEVSCADGIDFGTSCGCGAGPDGAALAALLLMGLGARLRRRRGA